ncbi:hypothetical protein ACJ73_08131 [Blastomyces percursus]|uniref:Uncharacterized protein n=1 Tax=Blastomyces percursus TaxID=1658174 RepID=A0A1J9QK31_9EURO|nr:hypothetical protein ACJ73_08131 [Blastomyces percursus]
MAENSSTQDHRTQAPAPNVTVERVMSTLEKMMARLESLENRTASNSSQQTTPAAAAEAASVPAHPAPAPAPTSNGVEPIKVHSEREIAGDYATSNGHWRTEDLGFFHPDLFDNADAAVKTYNNQTYYRNVYVFADRVRDMALAKGEEVVRNNVHAALRGAALDWYTVELTELEKRSLRVLSLQDGWIASLVNRFKPRAADALDKIAKAKYGMTQVMQG